MDSSHVSPPLSHGGKCPRKIDYSPSSSRLLRVDIFFFFFSFPHRTADIHREKSRRCVGRHREAKRRCNAFGCAALPSVKHSLGEREDLATREGTSAGWLAGLSVFVTRVCFNPFRDSPRYTSGRGKRVRLYSWLLVRLRERTARAFLCNATRCLFDATLIDDTRRRRKKERIAIIISAHFVFI